MTQEEFDKINTPMVVEFETFEIMMITEALDHYRAHYSDKYTELAKTGDDGSHEYHHMRRAYGLKRRLVSEHEAYAKEFRAKLYGS